MFIIFFFLISSANIFACLTTKESKKKMSRKTNLGKKFHMYFCVFFLGITKQRMSASYGHLQMVVQTIEINGLETKPYRVFEYFSTITYQFNLNYDNLVF